MAQIIKVTDVKFDFSSDDGYEMAEQDKKNVLDKVVGKYYIIDPETGDDELSDQISDETGWCVESCKYEEVDSEELRDDVIEKRLNSMSVKEMRRILGDQMEEEYTSLLQGEDYVVIVSQANNMN
jgi:hypothetical protein